MAMSWIEINDTFGRRLCRGGWIGTGVSVAASIRHWNAMSYLRGCRPRGRKWPRIGSRIDRAQVLLDR